MNIRKYFAFNADSEEYLDPFLIASIFSVLLIRFFLHATNFPQIGTGSFHIAHMLWGGFFMLIAIVLFAGFLNRPIHKLATVIGGIGFGAFIDELGKYTTADNNYFFEPAIAMIYVVFIVLYLAIRFINKNRKLQSKEYLLNALEITKNMAFYEKTTGLKGKTLKMLHKTDIKEPFAKELIMMVEKFEPHYSRKKDIFDKFIEKIEEAYNSLVGNRFFTTAIITIFVLLSIYHFIKASGAITPYFNGQALNLNVFEIIELISTVASTLFTVMGISRIFTNRLDAYKFFKISILISIFLTQVFSFYRSQLAALATLILNIVIFAVLQYMISKEQKVD